MKKKLRLIVVSLLAIAMIAAVLTGCQVFNDLTAISLVGQPKTQYYVGDEFDTTGFQVNLHYGDDVKTVNYVNDVCTFENDFSSAKAGNFKCTIGVKGYTSLKFSFDYSVIDPESGFAEGDGSVNSPYIVTSEDQFKLIGKEAGKNYKLGKDLDLTKVNPAYIEQSYWRCYNNAYNQFVLDGANYKLTIGGKVGDVVFRYLRNSTLKNLEVHIKPGSTENTIALYTQGSDVVFDNVKTYGLMSALYNDGVFVVYNASKNLTFKNCVNNVNMMSSDTYIAAFCGMRIGTTAENITFDNCTNNGNLEAVSSWVFLANSVSEYKSITIKNCTNNGKLAGAGVGLVNAFGPNGSGAYLTSESYTGKVGSTCKLTISNLTANTADFVVIPKLFPKVNSAGKKVYDLALVKDGTTVKFADNVKTKLDEEFGEDGYTVSAKVRYWASVDIDGTNNLYTDAIGLDGSLPYVAMAVGDHTANSTEGAIKTDSNNKLLLPKTLLGSKIDLKKGGNGKITDNQVYCYYVYDAEGVLKYCGQIYYDDMQKKA